jgi:ABC-type bacteriocin/lantibiotic exporter with double-glycine peptidase domain
MYFFGILILNAWFIHTKMKVSDFLTYTQYTELLCAIIINFYRIMSSYQQNKIRYNDLNEKLRELMLWKGVDDVCPNGFVIKYMNFNIGNFSMRIDDVMVFNQGDVILLVGDSGSGKSSFVNIIGGWYTCDRYNGQFVTNGHEFNSFQSFNKYRVYSQQNDRLFTEGNVVQNIAGDLDNYNMINVMESIYIGGCDDFVNDKNMYNSVVTLSGGQKSRILVARIIYKVLSMGDDIKYIILDEIDKAIQPELGVEIMRRIIKLCKKLGCMIFVVAHTTEVKQMDCYNVKLHFNGDGIINCKYI